MKPIKEILLNTTYIDKPFWYLFGGLILCSFLASFSASAAAVYSTGSILAPISKQAIFLAAGLVVAWLVQFVPTWAIRASGWLLWIPTTLILWYMKFPGLPGVVTINGATRWFNIGIGPNFQPSDVAKLAIIIVLADLLSRAKTPDEKRRAFWYSLAIAGVTALPILTQNLSTALLIGMIVLTLWLLTKMPWREVVCVSGGTIVVFVLFLLFVDMFYVIPNKEYHGPMSRATTWCARINRLFGYGKDDGTIDLTDRLTDKNRQEYLSKAAIARGGASILGVGVGQSLEARYLPLADSDAIFAIIVEETGFGGATILIVIYLMILFRACFRSAHFPDSASTLMVLGLALMIVYQTMISMMVCVGIIPVTGQPMPLIAGGGTQIIITSVYFGIMMSVSRELSEMDEGLERSARESYTNVPNDITFDNDPE